MPKPQKSITALSELRFREFISAVEATGNMRESAKQLGIHWGTLHQHMKLRPDLTEELRRAQEIGKQNLQAHLEAILLRHIEEGNITALIFKLKQLDPSYRESYHVTTSSAPTDYVIDLTLPDGEAQSTDNPATTLLE
jgi:hypothetical protein